MKLNISTLLVIATMGWQLVAAPLTADEKRDELEGLANLISTQYGPLQYKKRLLKLDLDALVETYAKKAKDLGNNEFYYLLNQFVAEFRDTHFSSRLATNLVTKLGFITDLVDGKILLDEIDRSTLSKSAFPFERGDELVSLGGRPAMEVAKELGTYRGHGNPATTLRSGVIAIGFRRANTFPPQSGKVTLEIRRGTSSLIDTVELEWLTEGDPLIEPSWTPRMSDYVNLSIEDFARQLPDLGFRYQCSGTSRVERPKDATVLIEKPFVAYTHPTEKGTVGYLRIPHYYWRDAQGNIENDFRFLQYEWVISEMEKNTVGLIIDQDHNCGGSVSYLERMVSLFADKPFRGLEFQFLATRGEYLEFRRFLNDATKKTVDGQQWMGVLELIKTAWLGGDDMTTKTTFNGTREVPPNATRYTKPVIVLTDEMSGSGGDAFPAMMQGLGLARVMGSRTMGAGGHVVEVPGLYHSGNSVRLTKSLFYHPNGTAIENNGVTPDIAYNPTRADFLYGYREYQQAYLNQLFKLIP